MSGGSEGVNTSGIKDRENQGGKVKQSCNRFAALLRGGSTLFLLCSLSFPPCDEGSKSKLHCLLKHFCTHTLIYMEILNYGPHQTDCTVAASGCCQLLSFVHRRDAVKDWLSEECSLTVCITRWVYQWIGEVALYYQQELLHSSQNLKVFVAEREKHPVKVHPRQFPTCPCLICTSCGLYCFLPTNRRVKL